MHVCDKVDGGVFSLVTAYITEDCGFRRLDAPVSVQWKQADSGNKRTPPSTPSKQYSHFF